MKGNKQKNLMSCDRKNYYSDDYLIGLDIGTDSIGWAVTDMRYNLLKFRGTPYWGSYLFDEAETAENKRLFRSSRRRTARVHNRLMLLQSLFADEISKVDDTFFLRMNESKLFREDKNARIATKYILFGDKNYTDKDYFKQYPTIFHLRYDLTENAPNDIRLLYLACHHIVKNRGHFLFEGQRFDIGDTKQIKCAFKDCNRYFAETAEDDEVAQFDLNSFEEIIKCLKSSMHGTEKKKKLEKLLNVGNNKRLKSAVAAISGVTFSVADLYGEQIEVKLSFDKSDYESEFVKIVNDIGEDDAALVAYLKKIYDFGKLGNMLGDCKFISEARVRSYNMHRSDLKLLKKYVKQYKPDKYKYVFTRVMKLKPKAKSDAEFSDQTDGKQAVDNYAAYIGMDKHKSYEKATKDDFYKFLKKEVFDNNDENFKSFLDAEISQGVYDEFAVTAFSRYEKQEFLPKQITSDNGVIPFQLQLAELRAILDVASESFPFLSVVDEFGLTVKEKIIKLLTFRIPYYVGPLGGKPMDRNSWAVKNPGYERSVITPWNFDKAIDLDKSEERFIARMTNKCTYLPTEDVLPKNSLLYSEAVILSELNNIRINGQKNIEIRNLLYDYALTGKKITKKTIVNILRKEGIVLENDVEDISGIDEVGLGTVLSSHAQLKKILGDRIYSHRDMCENIIKWITLFSDKKRLKKRIKSEYGNILDDDTIGRIKDLSYSGWGRLSKTVLAGLTSDKSINASGAPRTIIETLRDEAVNLTEVLTAKRWGFDDAIVEFNKQSGFIVSENGIDDLSCSPSVKRAIRRTVAIVKEIVKVVGHAPKKICIETARGEDKIKKRTKTRKQQILDLYKAIERDISNLDTGFVMPDNVDDRTFMRDRVFLYYKQQGKCMYSGTPIKFEDLFNENIYDVDHIYPRTKINDDSLDNRVLVLRRINAAKSDGFPLNAEIQNKMQAFWLTLKNNNLISSEKYNRLVRKSPLKENEMADFENRQLVAVRQSTKTVAAVLNNILPQSEIVYSKAGKVSDFKDKFKLVKVRELNDLHHAKDAYINIIVGNTLNEMYGHDSSVYYRNNVNGKSDYKLFDSVVKDAWDPRWCERIAKTYNSNRCCVVRFVSEVTGQLFKATVKKASDKFLIPLKENENKFGKNITDTSKYGGYDGLTTAYFMLIKSIDKKGKVRLSLEAIPILIDKRMKQNSNALADFLTNKCKLISPEVIIDKIKINTLFNIDGSYVYIRGTSGNNVLWCNANELWLNSSVQGSCEELTTSNVEVVDPSSIEYLKKIMNFCKKYEDNKKFGSIVVDEKFDKITRSGNIAMFDCLVDKLGSAMYRGTVMANQSGELRKYRDAFADMSIETQCIVIKKIILYMQCNSVLLDLSDFGGTKHSGKIQTNKFIEGKDIKMITQSSTGYYRNVISLKDCL